MEFQNILVAGAYTAKHNPLAIYSEKSKKHFVYGGAKKITAKGNDHDWFFRSCIQKIKQTYSCS